MWYVCDNNYTNIIMIIMNSNPVETGLYYKDLKSQVKVSEGKLQGYQHSGDQPPLR